MDTGRKKQLYKEFKQKLEAKPLPKVQLPTGKKSKNPVTIGDFATEFGKAIRNQDKIFFKPELKSAVEIIKFLSDDKEEYLGFSELSGSKLVTLAEKMAYLYSPILTKMDDDEMYWEEIRRNMKISEANLSVISEQFLTELKLIRRIFSIPFPIVYEGEITFPREKYDHRFKSWLTPSDIKIEELKLKNAIDTINSIFKEFCFEKDDEGKLTDAGKQSKTHAIAALITPFLRGLYPAFNTRTPLFFYIGNRPRVGKDYCAALGGLLYEGIAIEEPPISTGKRNEAPNEELRKKILSVILRGRRRLHFSNNKGKINSAMLENIITSKTFSDRLLGKNEVATFDNELEFSMSGNIGITFSPDLSNRARFINLFLDIEDPNTRTFEKPNLHSWVLENRSMILSAIYTLVKTWHDAGSPKGKTPYTSFPEWAEICGGIMTFHNFGNPCLPDCSGVADEVDEETANMKKLFELLYQEFNEEPFKKQDIFKLMEEGSDKFKEDDGKKFGWQEKYDLFKWAKFGEPSGKIKFSKHFIRNVNRIYSNLKLKEHTVSNRTSRSTYYLKSMVDEDGNQIKDFSHKNLGDFDK